MDKMLNPFNDEPVCLFVYKLIKLSQSVNRERKSSTELLSHWESNQFHLFVALSLFYKGSIS